MEEKLQILKDAKEYIDRLNEGILIIIDNIRGGKLNKAYQLFIQVIEGLEWLCDIITLTQDVQEDKMKVEDIKELSLEMIEAMENKDNVLLADLLEYELIDRLNIWKEQLIINIKQNRL